MQDQKSLEDISQVEDVRMVFALQGGRKGDACRGVYSSLDQLKLGVDHWMEYYPRELLSYQEFRLDYAPEPYGWDWCYIPTHFRMQALSKCGANVPTKSYWGRNLINLSWIGIHDLMDYKKGDIVWYDCPNGSKRVGQIQNRLETINQYGKKSRELWVKWLRGEGFITLELLLRDMSLNGIELHKM